MYVYLCVCVCVCVFVCVCVYVCVFVCVCVCVWGGGMFVFRIEINLALDIHYSRVLLRVVDLNLINQHTLNSQLLKLERMNFNMYL